MLLVLIPLILNIERELNVIALNQKPIREETYQLPSTTIYHNLNLLSIVSLCNVKCRNSLRTLFICQPLADHLNEFSFENSIHGAKREFMATERSRFMTTKLSNHQAKRNNIIYLGAIKKRRYCQISRWFEKIRKEYVRSDLDLPSDNNLSQFDPVVNSKRLRQVISG